MYVKIRSSTFVGSAARRRAENGDGGKSKGFNAPVGRNSAGTGEVWPSLFLSFFLNGNLMMGSYSQKMCAAFWLTSPTYAKGRRAKLISSAEGRLETRASLVRLPSFVVQDDRRNRMTFGWIQGRNWCKVKGKFNADAYFDRVRQVRQGKVRLLCQTHCIPFRFSLSNPSSCVSGLTQTTGP